MSSLNDSDQDKKLEPIHMVDENDGEEQGRLESEADSVRESLGKLSVEDKYADIMCPIDGIDFVDYKDENQIDDIMRLVGRDLSEPYSIFTYRFFLHQWPNLCILAMAKGEAIGCIVCKIDEEEEQEYVDVVLDEGEKIPDYHEPQMPTTSSCNMDMPSEPKVGRTVTKIVTTVVKHGYIGMLAVDKAYRKHGIGNSLVNRALLRMKEEGCVSVVLETEISNKGALRLYEKLGFIREEYLMKYYLNWGDAYRLRLWYDDCTKEVSK